MSENFLVIGGGIAGSAAVETLRNESDSADITLVTDESEPLYSRIMLKNYMKGTLPKQYTRVHDEKWYENRDIDLHLGTRIEEVDLDSRTAYADGKEFSYDKLLVATGGSPRKHPLDTGFENVHYMWTWGDADSVKDEAEASDSAVVIGGGLLGIDLAMAYASNGADTHYIIRGDTWWRRGLTGEGADIMHRKMEDAGIDVVTNAEVEEFEGSGSVTAVAASGERYECDSVAVAIGQEPNSGFIDVEKSEGMIAVDECLETSRNGVYAAGNMVEYRSPLFGEATVKGSWDHSEAMGETAARNMLGTREEFDYANTYGVGHFDVQFLAIGDWEGDSVERRYSDEEYRRLFFDGDQLVGAVLIGYTKGQERIRRFIEEKKCFDDREALLDKEFWE